MNFAVNRKARHEYEVIETFTAGVRLAGWEVKSIRLGHANLRGNWVSLASGVPTIRNMHIRPYDPAAGTVMEPTAERKLLLTKKEIQKIEQQLNEQGRTLVVLRLFPSGPRIKAEVGLVRGKNKVDKRNTMKERTQKRAVQKALKGVYR